MNIQADKKEILSNTTEKYFAKIIKYYRFLDKLTLNNEIDLDYVYLDMIETSNKILYHTALYMLHNMIAIGNVDKANLDLDTLEKTLKRATLDEKKVEIQFLCKMVDICRHYPAYSDHFANLIEMLCNLPLNKLNQIAEIMEKFIRKHSKEFKTIMRPEMANAIGLKLELLSEDIKELREFLLFIRKLIVNSYKVFSGLRDEEMLIKSKALRILLDIIDKAFDQNGEDFMDIEYDTTIRLVRQWGDGYKHDIESLLKCFFGEIVHVIKHVLSPRAKQEFQVLLEIICKGEILYKDIFNELFFKGSKFMNEEDDIFEEFGDLIDIDFQMTTSTPFRT